LIQREVLAVYVSRGRSILNTLIFLKRVFKACENKPVIVVDRGPWYIVEPLGSTKYPWALKRLGIEYFHETFGERNRIERWFRKLKERIKAIALLHNITTHNRNLEKVILTDDIKTERLYFYIIL